MESTAATMNLQPLENIFSSDSLQQLRRLHAAVQRMRTAPLPLLATGTSRLSTSCPSLCKDGVVEADCSSPTHLDFYPQSRKGSGESTITSLLHDTNSLQPAW
ncbi:hypothetical protein B5X24_HaOG212594 [Helicoverpa armigera]|uniref:Uncharacterized protein n=1 Tax=Helicoverpa armigera TaxID=29058 RepID=A0A2W1B6S1_HELAM|nr:hypothetical protein B5X24_HaOG212594 [Helicoverpa armigera]